MMKSNIGELLLMNSEILKILFKKFYLNNWGQCQLVFLQPRYVSKII